MLECDLKHFRLVLFRFQMPARVPTLPRTPGLQNSSVQTTPSSTHLGHLRCMSKRMHQFVKICVRLFDKKSRRTFMVCAGNAWIRNCGAFCQTCRDFCQTHRNSEKAPHFHGKRRHNPAKGALYKTAYCGAAIKVLRFWWEKSGTHAAMFSSAAATSLLHSF